MQRVYLNLICIFLFGLLTNSLAADKSAAVAAYNSDDEDTYNIPSRPGGPIDGDGSTEIRQQHHPPSMLCLNIKPQHSVDIAQITGLWYGNEIIMHTQDTPGIHPYNSCVKIYLNDVTDQMRDYYQSNYRRPDTVAALTSSSSNSGSSSSSSATLHRQQPSLQEHRQHADGSLENHLYSHSNTRYLRLIWSEKDDNIEYNFNYTMNHPGLWNNVGEQRGSMVALNNYNQFTGSVQVVKAVSDHLVLTFCASDMHHSIYSIVLSRQSNGLKQDIIRSIRNLLQRRGLYTESIRKVCVSSAITHGSSAVICSLLFILICITKRFY